MWLCLSKSFIVKGAPLISGCQSHGHHGFMTVLSTTTVVDIYFMYYSSRYLLSRSHRGASVQPYYSALVKVILDSWGGVGVFKLPPCGRLPPT